MYLNKNIQVNKPFKIKLGQLTGVIICFAVKRDEVIGSVPVEISISPNCWCNLAFSPIPPTLCIQREFHTIAREMSSSEPTHVRYSALQRLCKVPPSDVMASENWSDLCVSLMDALADNDPLIANKALSFHAKMFAGLLQACYVLLSVPAAAAAVS